MTEDPVTGMTESAVAMHEAYRAWRAGGFTRNEALTLVVKYMVESNRKDEP